jgi:signal transduction histidine kinase
MLLLLVLVVYAISILEKKHQTEKALIAGQSQIEIRQANIVNIVSPLVANARYLSKSSLFQANISNTTHRSRMLEDLVQFASVNSYLGQVRVIDTNGVEVMRVNSIGDSIIVVNDTSLQTKNRRSYFETALQLQNEEIYISPIELNREYDSIEKPYHAVARIISPIIDTVGNRKGFFVSNISVENLVAAFNATHSEDSTQLMVLNYKGEGIYKKGAQVRYNFRDVSLAAPLDDSLPHLWQTLQNNSEGHLQQDKGVYVFKRIGLAEYLSAKGLAGRISIAFPQHSELILISYVPIAQRGWLYMFPFVDRVLILLLFVVMVITAIVLTYRKMREERIYKQVGKLNDELIKSQYELNTDRKKLENTVMELSRRNTQLKEFSHIISHNIRSPISGLTLLVDFLAKDANDLTEDERKEITEKLVVSTTTLNNLTEDLMETVSVLDEGEIELQEVELTKAIDKAKDVLTDEIVRANATLKVNLSGWTTIHYNKLYLESILFNLMSNAIKYRSTDKELIITITTTEVKGRKELRFSDNGRGINMRWHSKNVFGLHKTFHRDVPGKGFGLFMTKTQIESLGGRISVESEEGKGSTFIIVF